MFGSIYRFLKGQESSDNDSDDDENEPKNKNTNMGSIVLHDPQTVTADLLRTSWCKNAVEQVSGHCCHLFDYIKSTQGNEDWGHVLDAGSGSHSLDWIMELPTRQWTALIGDHVMRRALEENFGSEMRSQDRIIIGNWKDKNLFAGEVFDVVIADYLIGAMDAFAPYFQEKFLERLKPHVGKRLYITGAEPFPDRDEGNPHGQMVIEVAKLRDACILLAGERPYREFPMDWVLRSLKQSGYKVIGVGFFETNYSKSYVLNQVKVAESKLKKFKNVDLAEDMKKHIRSVRDKVKSMTWDVRFSSDYVIAAIPIQDQHETTTSPEVEPIPLQGNAKYKSPVQEQNEVFPIDEE